MNWKRMNLEELKELVASVSLNDCGRDWTVKLDDGTTGITTNVAAVSRYQDKLSDGRACANGYTMRSAYIALGEATRKSKKEC